MKKVIFSLFILSILAFAPGSEEDDIIKNIDKKAYQYNEIARKIWDLAEVGYKEQKSSALLAGKLQEEGFKVELGVADIPTAFVATFGSGKPEIGILAEYDALPGISQDSVPVRKVIESKTSAHACGHNLFGTASIAAAIEIKNWLKKTGTTGTVKVFGTPAEEGGSGKVYMVRAGLFNNTDIVLHWHPGDGNSANPSTSLAVKSAKFRFYGTASHAAAAPERGRSALDGVEAMDYMVNMMREHVPSNTRIHYVITSGGKAPNVVPDFAEVYYYVRQPDRKELLSIWARLEKAAEGAALGTGTRVENEVIHGNYDLLPNVTLSQVLFQKLNKVGGVIYDAADRKFAEQIESTFDKKDTIEKAQRIEPFKFQDSDGGGSTDVGDVSWAVPTAGIRTATFVPGTGGHSWQSTAAASNAIGFKGMIVAAKTLAIAAVELYKSPEIVKKSREEFNKARGADFKYEPLLGNRKPALNYRD